VHLGLYGPPMRNQTVAILSLLGVAVLAACSSSQGDGGDTAASAQTDDDLARSALRNVGAKLQNEDRSDASCKSCHDPNKLTLKKWSDAYNTTIAYISDESKSVDDRINYMRRNPEDTTSGFSPGKLGILTAGTQFEPGATVDATRHPTVFKTAQLLSKLFAGKDDLYKQFKTDTLMPIDVTYDRLSAAQFETVLSWFAKGMPKLDELLIEEPRPTTCTDDFAGLKDHVRSLKSTNWSAVNRENRLPMFACGTDNPLECFNQKTADGKDIFPESRTTDLGKTWSPSEDNFRIARQLDYKTFYWMRSSADGRFVADGGGPRINGTGAVIADLGAALDPAGPKTRDIGVNASYDHDFFPANQGFMFQGGGKFCSLSLLTNPATITVSLDEPQCSKLDSVGLYQTVGQVAGDNAISDIFVVNSTFASDNPGLSSSDHDLELTAGPEATINIHVGVARGNDADGGYQIKQNVSLPTPFKGDTMMARSGTLLGSRVAGETQALGYSIDKLVFEPGGDGYRFSLTQAGRICMPGNKANFSFDERFLVTHHYLTRADFDSDAAWAPYKDKGASDIYLADFITGTKKRITRMNPGQFAIYPHFRSDGWMYFLVRDGNTQKETIVATDSVIRAENANP
jgi:hypothetical protein